MKPTLLPSGIVCIVTLLIGPVATRGADATDPVLVTQAWHALSDPAKTTVPARTLVDANGDVLVAGATSEPGAGFPNVWVAKYSGATGGVIWETTAFLGSTRDAAIDSQGNLVTAGEARVEDVSVFSVAKFSAQTGALMWHRTKGDQNTNDARGIAVDANDSVIATGFITRLVPSFNQNAYTVKYSSTGVFQWEQEYDSPAQNVDSGRFVAVDAAGDVVVAGPSLTLQVPGPFVRGSLHVAKYRGSDGVPVWDKLYENGTQGSYVAEDLELDSAGNPVIGGSANRNTATTDSYVAGFSNADGLRVWEYAPQNTDNRNESIVGLVIDGDGTVFGAGYSAMQKNVPYLLRLPPGSGVPVWERRLNGFGNFAKLGGVKITTRGELIAFGEENRDGTAEKSLFMSIVQATGETRWSFSTGSLASGPGTNQSMATSPDGGFASSRDEQPGAQVASTRKFVPTVVLSTGDAVAVAPGSVKLHGTIHPNALSPTVWFEWGTGDSLNNSTPGQPISGDTQISFEATLSGLAGGAYSYRAVAQYGETVVRGAVATFDLNAMPVAVNDFAEVPFRTETVIDVLQNDSDADGEALQILAYTQPQHGSVSLGEDGKLRFTPTGDYIGEDSFEYTITDNFEIGGAVAEVHASVTIQVQRPASVFIRPLLNTGEPVGGDEGNVFVGFANAGPGLILASIAPGATLKGDKAIVDSTGHLVLKVGSDAPGSAAGSVIAGLDLPSGRAFVATVRPPGRRAALERVLFAQMDDGVVPIMREGAACPGLTGVKFKKLVAFDGSTENVFFLATLRGTQVRPDSDCALWIAGVDGIPRLLLREGDLLDGAPVRGITTLVSDPLSSGEQRWVDGDRLGARLKIGSQREVLVSIDPSVEPAQLTIVADTADESEARYATFSLPAFHASSVAFVAKLKGAKARQRLVLDAGDTPITIAETGTLAPGISDASFQGLADPVVGADNALAFIGTIKGPGIGAKNNTGLWVRDELGRLELLARTGDEAPGVSGSRWAKFRAIIFPDDATLGPVFSADLVIGQGGVTAGTRGGLWAVDSSGVVRLLLRAGDIVSVSGTPKVLASIRPVGAPKAGVGGYDDIDGHIYVVATFSDRSQSILKIVRP